MDATQLASLMADKMAHTQTTSKTSAEPTSAAHPTGLGPTTVRVDRAAVVGEASPVPHHHLVTPTRVKITAVCGTAVVMAVISGCSSHVSSPGLRALGGGLVGGTVPNLKPNTSIVEPMRALCATGRPVRIDSITAAHPTGGMRVTSWGVRPAGPKSNYPPSDNVGGVSGLVSQLPSYKHQPVIVTCKQAGGPEESSPAEQLDVSLAGSAPQATMTGLTVHYGSGRTTFTQFAFAVCSTSKCAQVNPS